MPPTVTEALRAVAAIHPLRHADRVRYERLWERLLEALDEWAAAREVAPGRIEVALPDRPGAPAGDDETATPRELPGVITTEADPGHWPHRAPAIESLLATERPHLVGLQEMQEHTFGPVERGLEPTYRRLGMGTRGGSDGLINPILYDSGRLELVAWNQFWLSDRPREIGSATWGNAALGRTSPPT